MDSRHYDPALLAELRFQRSLSQEAVARELGWNRKKIIRAEAGESVTYETLCALAEFYKTPVIRLLRKTPAEVAA